MCREALPGKLWLARFSSPDFHGYLCSPRNGHGREVSIEIGRDEAAVLQSAHVNTHALVVLLRNSRQSAGVAHSSSGFRGD